MQVDILQTVLITIVAFLAYMERFFGCTMYHQPIIIAPVVGAILGDFQTGIILGATLELIFIGAIPIGASNPPDMVSGTIMGTAFAILTGADSASAVAIAIPVASLLLILQNFLQMFYCIRQAHNADRAAEAGNIKGVEKAHLLASLVPCIIEAIVVGICFYLGVPIVKDVLNVIPVWITDGMSVAGGILPALGFAMLAKMIITRELMGFLLIGFLLTAYLKLDTTGVALFGFALAAIMMFSKQEIKNTKGEIQNENEF